MAFDISPDASAGFSQMERWNTSQGPLQIAGTEEVMANLNRFAGEFPDLVQDIMLEYAEKILAESNREIPWKTTHLLQTGTIEVAGTGGAFQSRTWVPGFDRLGSVLMEGVADEGEIVIGYNTPYAARQHEDLTMYHPKPGRKAKYLEDPAMRIAPEIAPGIVARMQSYFETGVPSMTGMRSSLRASLGSLGGRYV